MDALKKLESHSANTLLDSYPSFMPINLPHASITQWLQAFYTLTIIFLTSNKKRFKISQYSKYITTNLLVEV